MKLSKGKQQFAAIGLLLIWCTTLVFYRLHFEPDFLDIWLLWNLFLAAVPVFWSRAFRAALVRQRPVAASVFFGLWLLFLPNAPYLLTDLVHLNPRSHAGAPLWYVLAMLLSAAGTGTLLGYLSLLDVHLVVEQKFGRTTGWIVAAGSLMLCGFGIYLGRFLRWNSWDAFVHPIRLSQNVARQFIDPGPFSHPLAVTLIYGGGLIVGYLALRMIAMSMRTD